MVSMLQNGLKKNCSDRAGRFPHPVLLLQLGFVILIFVTSCSEKPKADPCCSFSALPSSEAVQDGQGSIRVEGSTAAYYYVFDDNGKQLAYQLLNETLALDPGRYTLKVNHAPHTVEVYEGMVSKCSTGTLMVGGNTSEYYYVMDSTSQQLGYEILGRSMSFFPGEFRVKVNSTEMPVVIKLKELTEIRTGTLLVRGSTNEYYYVLDDANKQLGYNTLEKPLAFLPGNYLLKVNNTSMRADVFAGQITELQTGNVMVKGLTEEYYYVTDTLGNALNYQNLNKPLAFFPGNLHVKVNNTLVAGSVSKGETTEFATGSLVLTGGGTGYYYVLDDAGKQLNYNSLNKSLSFFPSEYMVKLGSSTRKARVIAGQLTAIDAFN